MFEAGIVGQFEAAHSLHGQFGQASRLHGHTYKVEVVVQGERLAASGILYDIAKLQESLTAVLNGLNYQNLNDIAAFKNINSTAEHVSKYICDEIAASITGDQVCGLKVTVWESPLAFASCNTRLFPPASE